MPWADEAIPYGARVLVRGTRVALAGTALANATAVARPRWGDDKAEYRPGEIVKVRMDEGLGGRDLHAIANGPIMDANMLYLPAGKLSMAEYRERERRNLAPSSSKADGTEG